MTVGLAEPFYEQRMENTVRSASQHAEPRESGRGEGKTCLYCFYCRRVFVGNEMAECAILKKVNSTASEVLNRKAPAGN